MSKSTFEKRLKRERKKKDERKLQEMVSSLRKKEKLEQEAKVQIERENVQIKRVQEQAAIGVVNYIADRNGCGYYRCIWPFELMATYKGLITMNSYVHIFDHDYLKSTRVIRFQRQATDQQRMAWDRYLDLREKHGYHYRLVYEMDDLLPEIHPSNKIAYDFFDENKKQNHMYMMKSADRITLSTESLREAYVNDYGVDREKTMVVKNTVPQFLYNFPPRMKPKEFNTTNNKPRILWSGSASHVGPGGDLEFLIPMIEKTVDEYQWVFQGCVPPQLENYVKLGVIHSLPWVPTYSLPNIQFYMARPDIFLAPLMVSHFNECKSHLKYLEGCALGAPCITTSFLEHGMKSPYDDVSAEICLEPNADIWKTAIDTIIKDQNYYLDVVKKQYIFLNSNGWMEQNLDQWMKSIEF